jgi:hypothetical protein
MAVVSATITTATASVAVGVAVLAASPTPVANTANAAPAAAHTQAATGRTAALAFDVQRVPLGIAKIAADVLVVAAQPDPTPSPVHFDTQAMHAGFAGSGYSFTMRIDGFPRLTALGSEVRGTIADATHFTLEFPASTIVSRYTRTGATAVAMVGGHELSVAPGQTSIGDLTPEELTPDRIWSALLDPWVATLKPDTTPGTYHASPRELLALAKHDGYAAKDWAIQAANDATGRLTSLTFTGLASGAPFTLEISVAYD